MKVVQLHFVSGWSGWDEIYIHTDMSHEGGYYFIKRDTGNVVKIPDDKVRGEPVIWANMTSGSIWTVDTDAIETRDRCMDDIRVLEVLWLMTQHFGSVMDNQDIVDLIVPVIRRQKYGVKKWNGKNILTHPEYQEERDVLKEAFNLVRMAIDEIPNYDVASLRTLKICWSDGAISDIPCRGYDVHPASKVIDLVTPEGNIMHIQLSQVRYYEEGY